MPENIVFHLDLSNSAALQECKCREEATRASACTIQTVVRVVSRALLLRRQQTKANLRITHDSNV